MGRAEVVAELLKRPVRLDLQDNVSCDVPSRCCSCSHDDVCSL